LTTMLVDMGWDGAVTPGEGDFLMIIDSNIGYNKTNAAVETKISYDINLTQPGAPSSTLVVLQINKSPGTRSCLQFSRHEEEDIAYPIYYCYYDYMRVFVPFGTQLMDATPHQIPADWMILKQPMPAQVDDLGNETTGFQAFGTLVVVPGGQTLDTRFEFALPPQVVTYIEGTKQYSYSLKFRKQPGTLAIPALIRVHLPPSAQLDSINLNAVVDGTSLMIETNLRTDVNLSVVFSLP
jgi:hypothetical protein